MPVKKIILLIPFLMVVFLPAWLFGQYYNLGQDPASLKWRQIVTPEFRIIYPETFELKAQKMVPSLSTIFERGSKSLDFKPKRVPVILHNNTIVPNALTVWAPKRIELYTCPPQDLYAQDWLQQLMIHEYRHVVQLDRTNQGFTKALSWVLGEQAAIAVNGLYVPSWFMEGDAVCAETVLSQSGRGRIPAFEMPLRAQSMQKGAYSYDKAVFGSYKTFVPNQYTLGYALVANVRRKYGYQAWVTALDKVAQKPYMLTPFNRGLKQATGFRKELLYRTTMNEMDSLWNYQRDHTTLTKFNQLTAISAKGYTNFKNPEYLNNKSVIALQTSLGDVASFVSIEPDGDIHKITTPGFLSSDLFSVIAIPGNVNHDSATVDQSLGQNYLLAYTETINDPRWEHRKYSVPFIYDSRTGKTREISRKSRYFAPAFSPDGKSLLVVKVDTDNRSSVLELDVQTGNVINTFITSDSIHYLTPSWSADGSMIVFVKLDSKGKSIDVFSIKDRVISTVVQPSFTEISSPVFAGDYILFTGSFSGIDNIYAVNRMNRTVFQVTSSEFGASNARLSPDHSKIVYSNYTSDGFGLVETEYKPENWVKLDEVVDYSPSLYKYLVKEEEAIKDSYIKYDTSYTSQPYKKAAHIFNFHSWAPAYINYLAGENGTGISFMSQNDLSTATTVVGYKYDIAENTGKFTLDFNWLGWYPIIDFNASYGGRAAYTGGDTSVQYHFNETIISGGLTLPLIFTGGKYYKGIRLKAHTSLYSITNNTSPRENKLTGTIHSLDYSFYAYRFIKQSYKDLYPRWGQVISGSFRHSPFGDNDLGSIASAAARLYFPGFIKHHAIRIDLNIQERVTGKYQYSNQVVLPRGYVMVNEKTLSLVAVNYKFPFAYPDFSLGPLAYIKRLKANLFFDNGIGVTHGTSRKLQSTGIELSSDIHFLRFVFPVDIGFRAGYRPIEKQSFVDFLFSVNLSD